MSKQESKHRCEERVYGRYSMGLHGHQCSNNGKVKRDGKWYCLSHDPVRIKEKQDARDKKEEARWAKSKEAFRRHNAEWHYCQNLDTEYLETHVGEKKRY